MIAFMFGPIKDMMNIHLYGVIFCFATQYTFMAITALNQLTNGFPALTAMAIMAAFPMRGFFTSQAISRIIHPRASLEALHKFWTNLGAGIKFGMITTVFIPTFTIAERPISMRAFTLICLSTVRTNNYNLVLSKLGSYFRTDGDGAFSGTKMSFVFWNLLISASRYCNLLSTKIANECDGTAILTPFFSSRGQVFSADYAMFWLRHFDLLDRAWSFIMGPLATKVLGFVSEWPIHSSPSILYSMRD